eukprot:13973682-Alexandrium_andersonii.AAC.1
MLQPPATAKQQNRPEYLRRLHPAGQQLRVPTQKAPEPFAPCGGEAPSMRREGTNDAKRLIARG